MKGSKFCLELKRDVVDDPRVVFMQYEVFKKTFHCESFLKVILNSDYLSAEVSKSYYYYILGKLRNLSLIQDNKVNFSMVIPFKTEYNNFTIKFEPPIVFVSRMRKMLYIIDYRRCNIDEELLKELELKDGKRDAPCKKIVEEIFKHVIQDVSKKGVIYV